MEVVVPSSRLIALGCRETSRTFRVSNQDNSGPPCRRNALKQAVNGRTLSIGSGHLVLRVLVVVS